MSKIPQPPQQPSVSSGLNAWFVQVAKVVNNQVISAPATATSIGTEGQFAFDATHFYVCVAPNTWVRTTLATF